MAEPIFHYRGDSLDAYRAREKAAGFWLPWDNGKTSPALVANAGAFGGTALDVKATAGWNSWGFQGFQNWTSTKSYSILCRGVPTFSSNPSNTQGLMFVGSWSTPIHGFNLTITTASKINLYALNINGGNILSYTTTAALTITEDEPLEIFVTNDGTTNANGVKIYVNETLFEQTAGLISPATWFQNHGSQIRFGFAVNGGSYCHFHIDEAAIWEGVEAVPDYDRATYISSTALDASVCTGAGAGNIKTGETEIISGVTVTGTYDGSDRWSDPGVTNVRTGTEYKANSTTNNKTGTMTDVDALETKLTELWQLAGLDSANPMTVTPTSRAAGDVEIALTGNGTTSTTATRQP